MFSKIYRGTPPLKGSHFFPIKHLTMGCILLLAFFGAIIVTKANTVPVRASKLILTDVKGIVTDTLGSPIPGVVVRVKNTNNATSTNEKGVYRLQNVEDGATLVFSMIGYQAFQAVANKGVINIKLSPSDVMLEAVTITNGYRVTHIAENTSSTGTVGGKSLENKPFSTFISAMQGQVAGFTAPVTSGQPGGLVDVRIRGLGSLSLSSSPLFVIDGMIVNSGKLGYNTTTADALAGINQNDIERIDVLKDAAATALYGARGSTGVIVITTKRGSAGKTQIRLDTEIGVSSAMNPPKAGMPLTANQYAELFRETLTNSNFTSAQVDALSESYGLNSGKSNNWYDLVTRTGKQSQYNLSVNGGTEKSRFFGSLGYFGQEATTIGSDFRKISGLLNLDHKINNKVTMSVGVNVSNVNQNTPYSSQFSGNPTWAARSLRPFQVANNDDGSVNTTVAGNTNFPGIYNPLWIADNDKKVMSATKMLGNLKLKWDIIRNLSFTTYTSADYNGLEETLFLNATMGDGASLKGRSKNYYTRYFNWLARNQFDYKYEIPGFSNFYVSASVGYEAQKSKEYLLAADGYGFPSAHEDLTALSNAATPVGTYGQYSNYAFTSTYAIGEVNFQNKYALSASFRRDGSSRFPKANRKANFFSVGGTWNVHEEAFFLKQRVLSSLKIRSSYGTTGNAGLSNYAWVPQAGYSLAYGYAGYNGQQYSSVGNIDLKWETSKKFDIGTDIGFAHDRFSLTVDYYRNNIDGLIRSIPTSYTTGFSAVSQNVGSMLNSGWEFTVRGDIIRAKDFTWNSNFNISLNRNKITGLPAGTAVANGQYYLKEGYSFYTYYLREFAGVNPANGAPLYYTNDTRSEKTSNVADASLIVQNKQSNPKYTGGFNNLFTYKGITLGVDFNFNLGYWIYGASDLYQTSGTYYTYNKYQFVYDRRWNTPGQITDVPRMSTTTDNSVSTYRIYKGDHIRFRNLVVGYDFKNIAVFRSLKVSKLHLYGRATNLFTKTFDSRLPFDPEVGFSGFDSQDMLQYRTYTVGLNIGL
jgi:TonB-dependent starch-binding outer membrane protein SusC